MIVYFRFKKATCLQIKGEYWKGLFCIINLKVRFIYNFICTSNEI